MTLEELKNIVRQLIGRNKTSEAINKIIEWARDNHNERLINDSTLLKESLTSLDREKRLGIISNSEASTKQSQITYGVLGLLDNIDENNPIPDGTPIAPSSVTPSPANPSLEKLKILMLTANPADTTELNLDKEHADISQKLQNKQELFYFIRKKAVSGDEFREFTQQGEPDILHFSGHGAEGKYAGIYVQNDDKNGDYLIPIKGLKALFKLFKKRFKISVVLLNACYTQEQAAAISEYVEYVIGTNVNIGDVAASAFSSGFYFQLAEDNPIDIEYAFDTGRTAAVGKGAKEENFVIYKQGKLIEIE